MSTTGKLYCWIYGSDANNIFRVDIVANDTVVDLQEAIKAKKSTLPSFRDVDTSNISLWRVSIPFDGNLSKNLEKISLDESAILSPWMRLDQLLPTGHCLQIVVRPTDVDQIRLNCLVLGDHPSNIFELQIAATESTTILKHLIKEKRQPVFDHIPADAIALWKVSVPI
ncbi:hypothetical protein EDB84DRAFT_1616157, partial [Lactarius hengduanensis]